MPVAIASCDVLKRGGNELSTDRLKIASFRPPPRGEVCCRLVPRTEMPPPAKTEVTARIKV